MTRFPSLLCAALLAAACTPDPQKPGKNPDAMAMAKNLEANGDYAGAASIYNDMLKKPDAPADAYLKLAAVERKMGQADDAANVMKAALTKNPGDPVLIEQFGYALVAAGQSENAVSVFDTLIVMQPDNAMAYNGKAVAFDKSGNHVAAQEIYAKALTLSPDSVTIQNNLAMSMILNGQTKEAIGVLEPLAQKPGANATVRQNLALAYTLGGERKKALEITAHDLTPGQAQENMLFYEHYARAKKEEKEPAAPKPMKESTRQTLKDVLDPDSPDAKAPAEQPREQPTN